MPRGKLAGTVDAALLELFESERKERGFTVSQDVRRGYMELFFHWKDGVTQAVV